jgi:tetratricopeptide (TPR) repeat protein
MITAESPNQARTIAVVTPALWSPGSGQLSKIANQITDSGVGEFTSLAAAQQASAHLDNYFADAPSGVISAALLSQEKLIAKKAQVLGTAFNSQDFIDAAEKCYLDILSVAPDHIRGLLNLAGLYHNQQKVLLAANRYREVLNVDPPNPIAKFLLSSITGETNDNLNSGADSMSYVKELFDSSQHAPTIIQRVLSQDAALAESGGSVVVVGHGVLIGGEGRALAGHGCSMRRRSIWS